MKSAKKAVMMLVVVAMLMMSTIVASAQEEDAICFTATYATSENVQYVQEEVVNSANKCFTLLYDSNLDLDMDEAHLLAQIAEYEGGNAEEQELIMNVIASRRYSDYYPDDIKSIFCQKGAFYLDAEYWNSLESPSEENVKIAKEILEKGEVCEYTHYDLNIPETKSWLKLRYHTTEFVEKENFIFWK